MLQCYSQMYAHHVRFMFAPCFLQPPNCNSSSHIQGTCFSPQVSNAAEDARTLHPCESGAGLLKVTSGGWCRKISEPRGAIFWRCVMALVRVPEERPGFLRSCLVEGDPAQEKRVRRGKQRALLISIAFQILIVAALILFPLLTRGERITVRGDFTPVPPYNRGGNSNHKASAPHPAHGKPQICRFCAPSTIPPTITTQDHDPIGDPGAPIGPE